MGSHHFIRIYSKPLEYAMFFFAIKMIRLIDTGRESQRRFNYRYKSILAFYQRLIRMRFVNARMCFNPFIRFDRSAFIDDKVIRTIDLELMA